MSTPDPGDCEQVLTVIFDYVDGELAATDRQWIDAHLQRCRSCFSRAEFEQRLKGHLSGIGEEPPSREFEQRIRGLIGGFTSSGAEGDPQMS